jgi:predicted nucleic acid-binding protein
VTHYSPRYLDAICRKLHNNGEHAMKTASRIDEKGLSVQFEQLKEQLQARRLQIEQRYDQNHEISEAILRIVAKRKSELLSVASRSW